MIQLKKGINLGGYLSQCRHTPEHYESFIVKADLQKIADAGFDHVRIPVDVNVWEDEEGNPKESGYALTDRALQWCKEVGLNVILDLHKAHGYDFNDNGDKDKNNLFSDMKLQELFIKLWERNAQRYGQETHLAFELLNEVVEEYNVSAWNDLIAGTVSAIRAYAPTVPIIYGGIQWNNVKKLQYLDQPNDENVIFTFHFYSPMQFTHQKAPWVHNVSQTETAHYPYEGVEDGCKEAFREMMMMGVEAAKSKKVSLYCGEFGVFNQAPVEDTLSWYTDVIALFNEMGIGYAPWTYKWMGFGIWDEHMDPIREDVVKLLTGK